MLALKQCLLHIILSFQMVGGAGARNGWGCLSVRYNNKAVHIVLCIGLTDDHSTYVSRCEYLFLCFCFAATTKPYIHGVG